MGASSVSEYVASLNEEQRRHVSAFMDFMSAEYPQVIPKISFSMPMWLLGKKMYEGYLDGSRDLSRARCKMKKCCLTRGHITCGDCGEYESCEIIQSFLNHPGYKYGKYKQALEYIRAHGHAAFLNAAEHWTGAYGKYPEHDL